MCDTKYCRHEAMVHTPEGAWLCEVCFERYVNERQAAWVEIHTEFVILNGMIRRAAQ